MMTMTAAMKEMVVMVMLHTAAPPPTPHTTPQCLLDEKGWPVHASPLKVSKGMGVVLTTRTDVEASESVLPVTYDRFPELVEIGGWGGLGG